MKPKRRINSLVNYLSIRLFIGFLLFIQSVASAQNFHLLVFADTDDPGLSAPNLMNISYLTEMANEVCQATGLKNRMVVYRGKDFLASRFDQVMTTFKPEPDDVVFFYFMGHGWNNSETEEPMLLFKTQGQSPGAANSRNLKVVFEQLRQKGNRLTLAFGESCNSAINDRSRAKPGTGRAMNVSEIKTEQLKNLFLKSRAAIVLHTCKRGQKSNSSEDGGWFFMSFYEQYKGFVAKSYKQQPAEWEPLLVASTRATMEYAREQGASQDPVFRVFAAGSGQSVAASTPTPQPAPPTKLEKTPSPARTQLPTSPAQTLVVNAPETKEVTPEGAGNGEFGNTCVINRVAYKTLESHLAYLKSFRDRVMKMENSAAAEEFRKFYSSDRQEFFRQAPQKLNVTKLASTEVKWFTDTCAETAELLDETAYYLDDPQFRNNVQSKLAIPIDNLSSTVIRLQDLLRRCKE